MASDKPTETDLLISPSGNVRVQCIPFTMALNLVNHFGYLCVILILVSRVLNHFSLCLYCVLFLLFYRSCAPSCPFTMRTAADRVNFSTFHTFSFRRCCIRLAFRGFSSPWPKTSERFWRGGVGQTNEACAGIFRRKGKTKKPFTLRSVSCWARSWIQLCGPLMQPNAMNASVPE